MLNAGIDIEEAIARLSADPSFASFVKPQTGLLVWDAPGERILWASPAAQSLRDALTGPSGRAETAPAVRERLRALATGLAPNQGMRLERLRIDPARLAPPVTCACRIVELGEGRKALITAIVGAVPKAAPRLLAETTPIHPPAAPPPTEEEAPAPSPAGFQPRGTVRFVWQTDADARFTHVSPALAETVGPMAGDILGQSWDEVARGVVEDPDGSIAGLFARRETWSGRLVFWSIDNTTLQVPVDWAGMPVWGPDRRLIGFRGFGLLRTDAARERAPAVLDEAPVEAGGEGTPEPALQDEVSRPSQLGSFAEPESEADEPVDAAVKAEPAGGDGDERAVLPEAIADGTPTADPEAAPEDRDASWFAGIRQKVAGALSGARPAGAAAETAQTSQPSRAPKSTDTSLSSAERSAFREIARALGARFEDETPPHREQSEEPSLPEPAPLEPVQEAPVRVDRPPADSNGGQVLDRLPVGVLVHRGERILFANRLLLDLVDYDDIEQITEEGGIVRLFRGSPTLLRTEEGGAPLALSTRQSESIAVEVRLSTVEWDGIPAGLMLIRKIPEVDATQRLRIVEADLRVRESRVHELEAILDTATDGVIVLDETGRILSLNRSAEALFGYDQREVVGEAITVLLTPESHIVALDYLEGLRSPGVASLLNDGREVMGRVRQGGAIPLFMTMGHVNEGQNRKFCAVLRDITAFKKAERELLDAKRSAEEANAQKSDLLAKISHEIRTPLNAIIGFAEVMLEERFGPVGNDRYKEYLKDVHASGAHVISLVNDLLDLAKIEAGRMELAFASVSLNDLVGTSVTLLQPQAARERIVMRTSFAPKLPPVVADERSVRQIVLNLVSNAIKFTDAGGQVIVSTALTDRGEVAFRVRDTGIGMSEEEVEAALEPFRQLATSRRRGGTGLGLPLTKALVEANRGALQISSNPNEGTLVEVIFPPTRVLAD